jgi:predicted enzyme related to lactoylglutathione lyase
MSKIEKHQPGDFCWFELGTTDQNAAKPFYAAVLGWTPSDHPMPPDGVYTTFKLNDADVAGAYTLRPQEAATIPPHWNLYVAVANADDTARRAAELGATIVEPPFDIPHVGRMAVLQDPTGAYFNIFQPGDHRGTGIGDESGTFSWADLSTPDPDRATAFYKELFGWTIGPAPNYPSSYPVIQQGANPVGGMQRNSTSPPHWLLFFLCDDVDAAAAKTIESGGAVHLAPMTMGGARFAALADPQGAAFSIIKPPAR